MYIISKKKDYYDGVVGTIGIDKTIIYERELVELTDNQKLPKPFKYNRFDENKSLINLCNVHIDDKKTTKYNDVSGFIVGFCGKLYLGWKFKYKVMEWDAIIGSHKPIIKTDIIYGYENAKKYLKFDYWRSNLDNDFEYFKNYESIELFRGFNSPIFIFDYNSITPKIQKSLIINPILKDYEFYKVIDAFTAFTELQMFISGVLGTGEKEMIEIEDKYKIKKHGFNKWSFRKEPQKK